MSVIAVLDTTSSRAYTSDVDELFAAILGAITELILAAFMEIVAAAVLDVVFRALLTLFTDIGDAIKENRVLAGLMYLLLGILAGGLSLLILPHRLITHTAPSYSMASACLSVQLSLGLRSHQWQP